MEGEITTSSLVTVQPRRQSLARRLLLAGCLLLWPLVIGWNVILSVIRPIWFAPPLFIYTPLIYAVLPFAWLLIFVFINRLRLIRSCSLIMLLVIFGFLMQCAAWLLISPPISPELSYLGANGELRCHDETSPSGLPKYICEYSLRLSDIPVRTYEFVPVGRLPFMILMKRAP